MGAKPPLPPSAGLPEAACNGVASRTLARMTLAEKVGQMVMVLNVPAFPGFTDTEALIRDHHVGSVVSHAYFGMGPADSAAHNNALQAAAADTRLGIPVLNAGDFEKGAGTIGPTGTTDLPTQMGLGATRSTVDAATSARITAVEALAMGFHWTFSPVGDLVPTPLNGEIGTRSFGSDVDLVSSFTATQVRTYQAEGMIATAKHFPGLGGSTVNSHFELPRVSYSRNELDRTHLPAFRRAIAAGVETIMTGHLVVEALDPDLPASLSPAVTTDLLRNELGFEGVIITDSMTLGALLERWTLDEAAVLAVRAGADIVMEIGPTEVPLIAIAAITQAVESGVISKKRINASVRRVLSLKCRNGLLARGEDPLVSPAEAEAVAGTAANLAAASAISRRAITLVKNEGLLPFDPASAESALVVGVTSEATVITTPPLSHAPEIAALVDELSAGPVGMYASASEDPTAAEISEAVAMAAGFDRIIVATYSAGPLPQGQADLVRALVATGKPVVAASIGTPYDIAAYPSVQAYVASYALNFLPTYILAPAALRATVEVIFGARPGGLLPVPIPNNYPFGHGLRYPA
jgi:beta-N-acetylhexosaminidase